MAVSITLAITQNSQSITNNTSNVTVKVTAKCTNGSYNALGTSTGSITIDGTKYSFSGIKYNTSAKSSWSGVVMTKTVDVTHDDDGTKELKCSASFDTRGNSGTVACSGSTTLTTIPRKSTLVVANGTLNTAQTLTVKKQASSFTHTITATCGSASTTIVSKSSIVSISFIPPISWASQNTTGTTVSVTYTITTYNGSTIVGSNSYSRSCTIPSSVKPTCSLNVTDDMGYADIFGSYLKGLSKLKVVVSVTTAYNSAIAGYKTTANGSTYTASGFITDVLASSGTLTVSTTVTDKRNRTGTASKDITVLDYAAPKVRDLTVRRCNSDGTVNDQGEYVQVTFSGSVTSLGGKNTSSYVLKYKKTTDSTYTSVALTSYANVYSVSNGTYIFAAETGSSYDVQISIKDKLRTTTRNTSASTAFTLMHFTAGGTGIGIGKVAESENILDIGVPVKIRAGIVSNMLWSGEYYMTANQTATLSEPISKQPSGIVLVFSRYDIANSESLNEHFCFHFVPKLFVSLQSGKGSVFNMNTSNETFATSKYLYITDTSIVGHDNNTAIGTGATGITYNNNRFVLRYVIGV